MSVSGGSVGSLVGAVVGGIIGSIIPGVGTALGASIGGLVGGLAGTLYDTATAEDIFIDQPKLSDINLQTSEYGQAIPQIWRRYRLAGNIIDLGDKLEFETRTYEKPPGSKGGGPQQITTSREYELSYIAFGICDTLLSGPMAGVARIWEDATVIYDIEQDAELPEGWVFYPGTADQDPDPTIEAEHGVGQTNAHRYLCYMVAAPLTIGPTGRVANYTFEVYQEGAEPSSFATLAVSPANGDIWALSSTTESLWRINETTSAIIAQVPLSTDPRKVNIGYPVAIDSSGVVWVANSLHYAIQRINVAGNVVDLSIPVTHSLVSEIVFSDGDGWVAAHHYANNTSVVYRFNGGGLAATISRGVGVSATMVVGADGDVWVANWGVGAAQNVQRISPGSNTVIATVSLAAGARVAAMVLGADGDIWLTESGTQQRVRRIDPGSNTIVANVTVGPTPAALTVASDGFVWVGCNGDSSVHRIDPSDNSTERWTIDAPVFSENPARRSRGLVPGTSGAIWAASVSASVVTHVTSAGVRTPIGTAEEPVAIIPDGTGGIWVACAAGGDVAHVIAPSTYTPLASVTGLRDILTDICGAAGIPSGNLNTSLVPSTRPYLALVNVAAARVPIETLMEAYQLFVVESGTQLKFGRVGSGSVVAVIGEDEWGASDRLSGTQGTGLQVQRTPEHLLPTGLAVNHVDPERSFQNNTQRAFIGEGRSETENVRVLSLAVGMLPGEAKARAQEGLDALWIRRTNTSGSLSQQYGYLEPGDRIQTTRGLTTYDLHIARTSYGRPGIVEVDATGDVANVVGVLGSAPGRGPSVNQNQAYASATEILLWNLPALTANDTAPRYHVTYASTAIAWAGAQLHRSLDGGTTYNAIDQSFTRGITGTVSGTMPAPVAGVEILDEATTLTVVLDSGTLGSVTDAELYNGSNLCVIGSEVCAFGVATLIATRTYTLSRWLRGRRGTEYAVGTHIASERFALIDIGMRQLAMTLPDRGVARQYKCVPTGDTLAATTAVSRTPTAENLMMWTPAYPEAIEAGSDWTLTWYHRSRWAGDWVDNNGIGFDSDLVRYEAYIYDDNTYTTVLRTITVAKGSDPEAQLATTYTAAQQITDFGSPQTTLYWGVLQRGSYGPGHESRQEATV